MDNDFTLEFKYDFKKEWKIFRKSLLWYLIMVFSLMYFFFTKEEVSLYIGLGFLIVLVPQIILHLQYRVQDRKKKIIVNYTKSTIRVEKDGKPQLEFNISDIEQIIRKKGQKEEDNTIQALPSSFYHYTKIVLKNGKKFFFTDFISNNIGIKGVEIEERIPFFLNLIY